MTDLLEAVRAARARIPHQGLSYGLLRYLGGGSDPLGLLWSPLQERMHLLEGIALVADGQFHVTWTYSRNFHRPQSVEDLARHYLQNLRHLCT